MVVVLGVARWLEPDAKGYGTHQQLGLPPCSSILLFGSKCPACGMTTAWSLAMDGRVVDAWYTNAGGLVLIVVAWIYMPIFGCYAAWGVWSRHGRLSLSLAVCLSVAMLLALVQWLSGPFALAGN